VWCVKWWDQIGVARLCRDWCYPERVSSQCEVAARMESTVMLQAVALQRCGSMRRVGKQARIPLPQYGRVVQSYKCSRGGELRGYRLDD
jgi:hypothetical protein